MAYRAAPLAGFSRATQFMTGDAGPDGGRECIVGGRFIGLYLATAGVIVLGAFVYTAIFAALGTWLKRPMPVALLFAFGWESMTNIPAKIQQMTVVFHLRNLIRNTETGTRGVPNLLLELMRRMQDEPPPAVEEGLLAADHRPFRQRRRQLRLRGSALLDAHSVAPFKAPVQRM